MTRNVTFGAILLFVSGLLLAALSVYFRTAV